MQCERHPSRGPQMTDVIMTAGSRFHDRLAHSWNATYQRRGFKRRLSFVRALISEHVSQDQRWLDAGCGAGILTLEMARLGARGTAVDGSPEMIAAALQQSAPLSEGFEFKRVPCISALDASDESFDGVLCSSVLEYVDDIDRALAELHRVLRVGGKVILSVPNVKSPVRRVQKVLRYGGQAMNVNLCPYLDVSVNAFTEVSLLRHLSKHGFRTLSTHGFDPLVPHGCRWLLPPALLFVTAEKYVPAMAVPRAGL